MTKTEKRNVIESIFNQMDGRERREELDILLQYIPLKGINELISRYEDQQAEYHKLALLENGLIEEE